MEELERFLREELSTRFTLKKNSIVPPTQYIGNKVSQATLGNGTKCWDFRSSKYIKYSVNNVEDNIPKHEFKSVRYSDKVITQKEETIKIYHVFTTLQVCLIRFTRHVLWDVETSE